MNIYGCANCLMHDWKQVKYQSSLKTCSKCKLIKYCGEECQAEHWKKVHKKQCRYFADPVKAQKWGHSEEGCTICIQAAHTGKAKLKRASNPNYECILKENFPPSLYHPHPFPISGCPEDTFEKGTIVLWQLLKKFELTQPRVIRTCVKELEKGFFELKRMRLSIWRARKISQFELQRFGRSKDILNIIDAIDDKVESDFMEDPFQLWKVIEVVNLMLLEVTISERLQTLLNPLADMPPHLHTIVSQGMSNSLKFLAKANQVLEALATQVISYQDVLKIICGGSLDKRCSFCSKKIRIANIPLYDEGSAVFFECLFMEIYRCESDNCREKADTMAEDGIEFVSTVQATVRERETARCDFCFKLPPSKGGHRCSRCPTVMYCSTSCRDQDWSIHKDFCKEDSEERKKKFGSSGRKKEARDNLEEVGGKLEESDLDLVHKQRTCEVMRKFRLKGASKKTDK